METNEQETGQIEATPEQQTTEKAEHQRIEKDIVEFFGEFLGSDARVALYRRSPMWCKGYLETYMLDSAISLDDIRDTWGGFRYELRVLDSKGKKIKSHYQEIAGPPLYRGEQLNERNKHEHGRPLPPEPDTGLGKALEKMMENQNRLQDRNDALMMKLIDNAQKPAPAPAPAPVVPPTDPAAQLQATMDTFKMMREFAQDAAPGGEGELSSGAMYLEMAKMLKEELGQRRESNAKQRGPVTHRQRLALPGKQAKSEPDDDREQESDDDEEEAMSIVDELVEAGPKQTVAILFDTLSQWSPEKQKEAIDHLTQGAQSGGTGTTLDENTTPEHNSSKGESDVEEEN
jgi:hypothetical protein